MTKANNQSFLDFARVISGKYSNFIQAQKNPKDFAHINFHIRPLNWEFFQGPFFYSEQSFNYQPWSPYRQAIHKLEFKDGIFSLNNYALKSAERYAGGGFKPELLNELNIESLQERVGCDMNFIQEPSGEYIGTIQPGSKCIVTWGKNKTYLVSKVEFRDNKMISLDQGYDITTNQMLWGSECGAFVFEKTIRYEDELENSWHNK